MRSVFIPASRRLLQRRFTETASHPGTSYHHLPHRNSFFPLHQNCLATLSHRGFHTRQSRSVYLPTIMNQDGETQTRASRASSWRPSRRRPEDAIPGRDNGTEESTGDSGEFIPLSAEGTAPSHTKKGRWNVQKGPKRKGYKPTHKSQQPYPPRVDIIPSSDVPQPTTAYLQQASLPPTTLPRTRYILIVMDLNGTLLFRPDRRRSHLFVERPFAKRFVQYCIDTFRVAVWSSARPENVNTMCAQLLGRDTEHASHLVAKWGRDKFGLSNEEYNMRVQCYKRLEWLWADPDVQASHPEAGQGVRWDQTNTVLVDDSSEKARSEPYNLLRIPEFSGDADEMGFVLPQVHDYLNILSQQDDVSRYIHKHPFTIRGDYKLEPPA